MDAYETVEAQKVHDIQTGTKALFLTAPIGLLIGNALLYAYMLMDCIDENRDYRLMLEGADFEVPVGYTALWKLVIMALIALSSAALVGILVRYWLKQVKQMHKKLRTILISMLLTLVSIVGLGCLNLCIQEFLFGSSFLIERAYL